MKAAVIREYARPLSIEDVDDPQCPGDGVILQVLACGVCRSDHHAWQGIDPDVELPHIPGHEFCGTVIEAGRDVTDWRVGDRAIAPFILGCGTCTDCQAGEATICATQFVPGFTHPGAFAEYIAVPRADFNLVTLPDDLSTAVGASMGCRLTTAFRALIDRANTQPGEWVVVWGCGGVGLSVIQIAKAIGARAIGIDINPEKLALASLLGAEATFLASKTNTALGEITELTQGGAHVSIDALGSPATFDAAMFSLRKMGRLVQIGMPTGAGTKPPVNLARLYSHQLTIHGTRGLPPQRFSGLFKLIFQGRLDPSGMIESEIALDQITPALERLSTFEGRGVQVITGFH